MEFTLNVHSTIELNYSSGRVGRDEEGRGRVRDEEGRTGEWEGEGRGAGMFWLSKFRYT